MVVHIVLLTNYQILCLVSFQRNAYTIYCYELLYKSIQFAIYCYYCSDHKMNSVNTVWSYSDHKWTQ